MKRDDIKEFLELDAGLKKSSRMLAEAEDDEEETEDTGEDSEEESEESDESKDDSKEVKVDKDEEIELNKSLDDSLNALFVDIETDALKSAAVQKESYSLRSILLEESDPQIDIEKFAAETARIIKNADVLLDIEEIIMSKARDYLLSKYDEDTESSFLDIMRTRFNVDTRNDFEKEQERKEIPTPIAVGAGGGEAGG